jgi:hypothetical protein
MIVLESHLKDLVSSHIYVITTQGDHHLDELTDISRNIQQ